MTGQHKAHLPKDHLNKRVQPSEKVSPKELSRLAHGQGDTTKRDAKTPQKK